MSRASIPIAASRAEETVDGRARGLDRRRLRPDRGRPPVHGLHTLKRAVRELGGRLLDRRTALGKALAAWKAELLADLAGPMQSAPSSSRSLRWPCAPSSWWIRLMLLSSVWSRR
jgi:hypothetical protein